MLFKCIINLAFVDPQYTIKLYDIIILKKHISLNIITRHGIILKILRTLITIAVNLTTIKLATISIKNLLFWKRYIKRIFKIKKKEFRILKEKKFLDVWW